MSLSSINQTAIMPALALLPAKMNSKEALAMLYAIGLQESFFAVRRQFGVGAALGFWQFERGGGTAGVLSHAASRLYALAICKDRGLIDLKETVLIKDQTLASLVRRVYQAFEHDDVLAAIFARLLLWTDPYSLPKLGDADGAFNLYIRTWRPGAYSRGNAHGRAKLREKFNSYYAQAVAEVVK